MARSHDQLNIAVLEVLRQLSNHAYRTVISVENPDGLWKDMPFVKRLRQAPGWIYRTADHCMHRRAGEQTFPRKRTSWLLYNVNTDIPLQKCDGSCGCCLPGTKFHRKLICERWDKQPGQQVIKCKWEKGLIPKGIFDLFMSHRYRSMKDRTNPNAKLPMPVDPVNEVLVDTHTAKDATVAARCKLADGKTFLQCEGLRYKTAGGTLETYKIQELRKDLANGHLRLRMFTQYDGIMSIRETQQQQGKSMDHLNDFIETAFGLGTGNDPQTVKEALAGPDADLWRQAIWAEIEALQSLGCWRIRPRSEKEADPRERDKKIFRSKIVLKSKLPANNMPGRKKARLCISDPKFLQRIHDLETFAPMSRIETVRFLLSTVVERNWTLGGLDVKNAFPIASLDEPVWMHIPQVILDRYGADHPELHDSLCYVEKSLYGLAVSPRCWNRHLDAHLRSNGYMTHDADPCLYIKYDADGKIEIAIATFVDDALFAGTNAAVEQFRAVMKKSESNPEGFQIVDSGVPTDFIGLQIELTSDNKSIKIHHEKYLSKAAVRFNVSTDTSKVTVPLPYDKRLEPSTEQDQRCDATEYRSLVATMLYSAVCCRPDAANAVRECSKFMYDPSVQHMKAARQTLAYLVSTKTQGITYEHGDYVGVHGEMIPNGTLEMFTDASFAENLLTRHSTSGLCSLKNRAVVTWASKSQGKVALSTGDAELRALCSAFKEVKWLRKLVFIFADPTVRNKTVMEHEESLPPTRIYEDNKSTIQWVKNPVAHEKVKHIDVPLKALREAHTDHRVIDITYIRTDLQLADGFTKPLVPAKHWAVFKPVLNLRNSATAVAA